MFRAYDLFKRIRFFQRWENQVNFFNAKFVIGRDDSLYPSIHSGYFEANEICWLLENVPDSCVVWDVGANVGIYSVLLGMNKPDRTIFAFEPVPPTVSRLMHNLKLNGISNVQVFPFALGQRNCTLPMHVSKLSPGANTLLSVAPRSKCQIINIEVCRADDLVLDGLLLPDVIKVDIEGYEPSFFQGAQLALKNLPIILLEFNPFGKVQADGAIEAQWTKLLLDLFELYENALLFDAGSQKTIFGLSDLDLDGFPRPVNLAFKRNV